MSEIETRTISVAEMNRYVARFQELKGSEEAFVDSRLPGSRRNKINLIGMGVVERTDLPDLAPNIPLPAHGFNLGMIQCEPGNGTKLHAHTTEEVFMPLVGPWVVTFMTEQGSARSCCSRSTACTYRWVCIAAFATSAKARGHCSR